MRVSHSHCLKLTPMSVVSVQSRKRYGISLCQELPLGQIGSKVIGGEAVLKTSVPGLEVPSVSLSRAKLSLGFSWG